MISDDFICKLKLILKWDGNYMILFVVFILLLVVKLCCWNEFKDDKLFLF